MVAKIPVLILLIACTMGLSFLAENPLRAATFTWNNNGVGNWSDPTKWTPNGVPGVGDSVSITGSTSIVTLDLATTVQSLHMQSGGDLVLNFGLTVSGNIWLVNSSSILNGAGDLTVNGNLTMTAGTINGDGDLSIGGNLVWSNGTIGGSGAIFLAGVLTSTDGIAILDTRSLLLTSGGTWTNQSFNLNNGAVMIIPSMKILTININSGSRSTAGTAANPGSIINNGTIVKNGIGEYAITNNTFDNNGTLTINENGMFSLGTGSSSTHDGATITIAADAELELGGSSTHIFDSTAISGAGTFSKALASIVSLNSGSTITTNVTASSNGNYSLIFNIPASIPTLTINSALVVINDNLTITGDAEFNDGNSPDGGISGDGNLTINGNLNWRGGKVSGNGTFTLDDTLTIDNNNVILDTRSLSLTSGGLISASTIVFTQSNGATLTIPIGQTLTLNNGGQLYLRGETLINNGTIEKNGSGTAYLHNSNVENNGIINVNQGNLIFYRSSGTASSVHDGATIYVAAGCELIFDAANGFGSSTNNFSNTSITGPGTFNVRQYSKVIWNAGTTVSNLPIVMTNGYLDINVNLTVNSLTVNAGTDGLLGGTFSTLGVTGNVIWNQSSADIAPDNPAVITVGGVFDLTNTGSPIFSNATITLNGGSTWTNSSCTMQNNAEFIIPSGQTLSVTNTSTRTLSSGIGSSTFINNGTLVKTGTAIFNFDVPYLASISSITDIQQGTVDFDNIVNIAGTLKGAGAINLAGATVVSLGSVKPGASPGTLTITGNYANTYLEIEIAESGGNVTFDSLSVSGTVTLGGTLKVIQTGSIASGSWTFLTAASVSGTFATLDLPDCYSVEYGVNSVTLYKGVTKIWDGTTNNWSAPAHWDPVGVPCPLDDVEIPNGICQLDVSFPEMTSLTAFAGGTLKKIGAGNSTIAAPFDLQAGSTLWLDQGELIITNDTFQNDGLFIGNGTIDVSSIPPLDGWNIAPGNSTGTLIIKGTYCNAAAAMEIGQFGGNVLTDLVIVTESMELGGNLTFTHIGGTVSPGIYEFAHCDGTPPCRTGTFASVTFPPACQGNCSIQYTDTSAQLVVTAPLEAICTWFGGTGNFSDPANWSCGIVPPATATIIVNSGQVNFNGNATVANATLTGGAMTGTGNLTVTGVFDWSGGTFNLPGNHQIASLALSGSPMLSGTGDTLSLTGISVWTDANLTIFDSAVLNVAAGATLTMTANASSNISQGGTGSLTIAGTLVKSGSAIWAINVPTTISGTLNVAAGTLDLNGQFIYSGTVGGNGVIDLTNATVQTSGNANFSPGASPGTLTVQGNYVNKVLNVEISESGGVVSIDQLAVNGNVDLNNSGSTLNILLSGGTMPNGIFEIMTFAVNPGNTQFPTVNFPALCDDCSLVYASGSISISNTQACIPSLIVSYQTVPGGTYRSQGDLLSHTAIVANGSTVKYQSDVGIVFQQEFTVELGGVFETAVQACPQNVSEFLPEEKAKNKAQKRED